MTSAATSEAEHEAEKLADAEREACQCGYCYVVLSVASFEPVYAEDGELVTLAPRGNLSLAA